MRSEEHSVGRRAMRMEEQGRRRIGRYKRRMLDIIREMIIREKGLSGEEMYDQATWMRIS